MLAIVQASAVRVRPRLRPSANRPAIRVRGSATVSPLRKWSEAVSELRPARHLRQQVGDADARQHRVEAGGELVASGGVDFSIGAIFSTALLERDIGQQAALRFGVDHRQPRVEHRAAARNETFEIGIDCDRQGATLQQLLQKLARDQALFEGSIAAAADDPNVARSQPAAQLRQHAELVVAPVERAAGHHIRAHRSRMNPVGTDFGSFDDAACVHLAQHLDGTQQRRGGGDALKGEGGQEGRRPAPHRGVMLAQDLVGIEILRTRERFRFDDAGTKALPRDDRSDRLERVPSGPRALQSGQRRRGHRDGPSR